MADWVTVVVLVMQPSPLRDSLAALLRSIPSISVVQEASDAASGLLAVEVSRPAMVLLDAGLPDGDAWTVLRHVKARWPRTQCLVLTDTVQLRRRAEAAGAHRALLKGFPAAKLSAVLEQLLQQAA